MYKTPSNREIASLLNQIADALEIRSLDRFRVQAFRRGARSVEMLDIDVADAVSEGRLEILPKIGTRLSSVIQEYVRTGASPDLAKVQEGIPTGLFEVLQIRGLGPKTVGKLFKELDIVNLDSLEQAATAGKIQLIAGMGSKKTEGIMLEIARLKEQRGRRLLSEALPTAENVIEDLIATGQADSAMLVGKARRGKPLVESVSILVATSNPGAIMAHFSGGDHQASFGEPSISITCEDGFEVGIILCAPTEFGMQLALRTGSSLHTDRLRAIAQDRGIGLDNRTTCKSEEEFYNTLGLPFIPPELRECGDEIEAAQDGLLPKLVTTRTLAGDLHCHTRWSDGANSIEEMAEGAAELGYQYIVISDHSVSLRIARGLDETRLASQRNAIRQANLAIDGIEILHGSEVDIRPDGTLDYPNKVLDSLNWVSAAVHSGFRQSSEDMTKRIIAAINNPYVDAIAHPTGRLLNGRDAYAIDMDAILHAAAATGTALEINAMPDRLDLPAEEARKAATMGVPLVVNSDSHRVDHLTYIDYGVTSARRAWLTMSDIVNTRDVEGLREWREDRRRKAP